MNLDQSADSDEDATENTPLMSEAVAMENRAYHADSPAASHHTDSSQPAVLVPLTDIDIVSISSNVCPLTARPSPGSVILALL